MENDEIENMLVEALRKIDTSSYEFKSSKEISNSEFGSDGKRQYLKLFFEKSSGEVSIEFIYHSIKDTLKFRTQYVDHCDEDEDFDETSISQKIPRTEEEYFQYSTIQNNIFSLEFYTLLEKIMSELLVKWKSK
ncbi:hypothetical protein GAP32_432 [Cronobacter phage vB_CsaM_GAP32]|uniref:Uncharacterized protein n=1 Tax=Cronobacter phage vB_CsaM_GAP32 TaxID=1141136 RepID=K4F6J8_9CAUD|nr:hypothetical protein GAP32_432 [Cronobacter phage vB_CsaM_GAP32]AFC21886.1 hypothetical protein GAP32_432 [Cronobacter phage vB_CsaM_GAP32]